MPSILRPPLCWLCKHLKPERKYDEDLDYTTYYCAAYPDGVPEAVFEAGHRYPKPGDHGIQFELKDGEKDLPPEMRSTQAEEDKSYRWYANYYEELNMTDEEFEAKMKREHGKNWHMYKKPSRDILFD